MITELDAVCPYCGATNELHKDPTGNATPRPGDVTVCWYCANACVFTDTMRLRPPTSTEINEILAKIREGN